MENSVKYAPKILEKLVILIYWVIMKKIMWAYETKDIINNLFISLKNNYQKEEQIMREGSFFKFESVDRLDYKLHKIKLR